jgi:hypothetical protein
LVGLVGVTLSWTALMIYSYVDSPGPTAEMSRVVAALAGGLPGPAVAALTVLAAALLGASGGFFGSALRTSLRNNHR